MAIPKFLEDLNIIARLGNKPGTDDGLSDAGFKAKFDEGILKIQNYINNVLLPGIEGAVDEDSLLSNIGTALASKLSLDGGSMRGPINMNFEILSGIETPTKADHAANKDYVDSVLKNSGSKHLSKTATIGTAWEGNTAPYYQWVAVEGILKEDWPHVMPKYTEDLAIAVSEKEAWQMVDYGMAEDGGIGFLCFEDKPVTAIPIQIEVNR